MIKEYTLYRIISEMYMCYNVAGDVGIGFQLLVTIKFTSVLIYCK